MSSVGGGASVVVQVQRCELVLAESNTVQLSPVYTLTPASGEEVEVRRGVDVAPPLAWRGKDHAVYRPVHGSAKNP